MLGSMQYGPAAFFPRSAELPAGPPSRGRRARDVRVPRRAGQSVGDAVALPRGDRGCGDKGARALEAFAYRYREGESAERFLVHRTIFPRDFLSDFGFFTVRSAGRVELARLELGGCSPLRGAAPRCCASSKRRSPLSRSPAPRRP